MVYRHDFGKIKESKMAAKIMKLIFWSNLPQKCFDLVKSSIFCARRNQVVDGSRPRMGIWGELSCDVKSRTNALAMSVRSYKSHECQRHFPT